MSLETGGRADKYGNQYENQYLVRLFLRLIMGMYKSVVVEPLGKDSDSIEYVATDNENLCWHFQCKASNGTHTKWSPADLEKYDVFKRSKSILKNSPNNRYVFVSPVGYGELDELCKRARTNESIHDFKNYQLNNRNIKTIFSDCANYYKLNAEDESQCHELLDFLSRCEFVLSPTGIENIMDLNERIGMYFVGNRDKARRLLENYVNSTGRYGTVITANEILAFMKDAGFIIRSHIYSENCIFRINELNNLYYSSFQPIAGNLIERQETSQVINSIKSGKSVILHGKAGAGKSGCVQGIVEKLREENILYLSLKIDKHIPEVSADNYGKVLGLEQSPIYCLNNVAAGKNCVLIIDQLDSLRWTNQHSAAALDICKEFISQAKTLNKEFDSKISIVFVSRTFDLENDSGLKSLFISTNQDSMKWARVKIGDFSEETIKTIIGDDYNHLSAGLKKLLLTPSSLYIWMLLNEESKKQKMATQFDLVQEWWKQLQNECLRKNISAERLATAKNDLVLKLETQSILSVPLLSMNNYANEIAYLISSGMIVKTGDLVSFAHQSFLDCFAVSEMIAKIYSGHSILDLIGDSSKQTPNIRYRIIRILQNILETDDALFIKISNDILESSNVRHYFKCAVFETIGQIEQPTDNILDYAFAYLNIPEWSEYTFNTVYMGHSQFVIDLDKRGPFEWFTEKGLALLYSINIDEPVFVISKLQKHLFESKETDVKIYNTLCHDCSDDNEAMLDLRISILEKYPEFLNSFWSIPHLIDNDSKNLVPILKVLINNIDKIKTHIYFGEDKETENFFKKHYQEIIAEIMPIICEKTKKFNPRWPNYEFDNEYRNWIKESYNEHCARSIVKAVKISMFEFASNNPVDFVKLINDFDSQNSVIYQEIIVNAFLGLDKHYSDYVISWYCSNPTENFFVYTGNQNDYLSLTKKVLEKHSQTCTDENFEKLEKIILAWTEPRERMIQVYKRRLEVNREEKVNVYYSYWGHLQKELLPFMDSSKMSKYSRNLLQVLNRNDWIRPHHFNCGIYSSGVRSVVSPLHGKAEKISDKTWLEIISTPNEKMKEHFSGKEIKGFYVEASHTSFASTLGNQAKAEPKRFALLSLSFPKDCYSGYVSNVISALGNQDEHTERVDFNIICEVIRRYMDSSDSSIIIELMRLIKKRSEEIWPDDIIDFVSQVAINFPSPKSEEYVITSSEDPEHITPHSLMSNAINCVRGCAIETLGELLWKHEWLREVKKEVILKALEDKNDAVRFSLGFCLFPYHSSDNDFCISILKELVLIDIRFLGFYNLWEIIGRDYLNDKAFYKEQLFKACNSNIDELNEIAAGFLCAAGIFYDSEILNELYAQNLNEKQVGRVCRQAASSFNSDDYHLKSEEVLRYYMNGDYEINAFGQLFYDRCLDINRDENFVVTLMLSKQNPRQIHAFLDFVSNQDKDITKYVNVIKSICERLSVDGDEWDREIILEDLIKCIIKLFDKNKYDANITNKCLDMWDDLYKRFLKSIRPFAKLFDNMS